MENVSPLGFRPGKMPPIFGDTSAALIVDDDKQTTELLVRLLERDGYHCTVAADAETARRLLGEKRFALALVDIRLPGQSGIELVASSLDQDLDLAVVMVSPRSQGCQALVAGLVGFAALRLWTA